MRRGNTRRFAKADDLDLIRRTITITRNSQLNAQRPNHGEGPGVDRQMDGSVTNPTNGSLPEIRKKIRTGTVGA